MHSIEERHHVLTMALWLMFDLRGRLPLAWQAKAVRYNVLMKDLIRPPRELVSITEEFNRNRQRDDGQEPLEPTRTSADAFAHCHGGEHH